MGRAHCNAIRIRTRLDLLPLSNLGRAQLTECTVLVTLKLKHKICFYLFIFFFSWQFWSYHITIFLPYLSSMWCSCWIDWTIATRLLNRISILILLYSEFVFHLSIICASITLQFSNDSYKLFFYWFENFDNEKYVNCINFLSTCTISSWHVGELKVRVQQGTQPYPTRFGPSKVIILSRN